MKVLVLVLACFVCWPLAAYAADGAACATDAHYTPGENEVCLVLSQGRIATGTVANSAIFDASSFQGVAKTTIFAFGKCPTDCEPGSLTLCESDSAVVGPPNVCHALGTLTGCGSALVSAIVTRRITKRYVWTEWAADITDLDCNDEGGVDGTLTGLKK